jgi:DNA modification methylase
MIQTIGEHKITNASIEDSIVDSMLTGEKIRILYSDPPWGTGNLKYWVTMNKKMTGKDFAPLTYDKLLDRIKDLTTKYVDGHVFIEIGVKWEKEVTEHMSTYLTNIEKFVMLYRSGSKMLPCLMMYGATDPKYKFNTQIYDPTNKTGADVSKNCIKAVAEEGAIVLDPCCGMGYTARAAVANKMQFRGNEFNSKRLQKTIDFLHSV